MSPSAHCFLTAAMVLRWDEFISIIVKPSCAAHACTASVLPVALLHEQKKVENKSRVGMCLQMREDRGRGKEEESRDVRSNGGGYSKERAGAVRKWVQEERR